MLYRSEVLGDYFVDKSLLLQELFPLVERGNQYICITRPRRFGKTVMANMLGAFFSKGFDSHDVFDRLRIHTCEGYETHINQHQVIYISFNELPRNCTSYEQYMERIQNRLVADLQALCPEYAIRQEDAVWDILDEISEARDNMQFIFVLDEWDFIFHRDFITEQDKKSFLNFLSNLLKDKAYVSLAYMTGILPIAKYSSGSELNMFLEYTMTTEARFSDYFGFTESEVDELYETYRKRNPAPKVTREGLRSWYNGYHTCSGERVYNPRSVVASLTNNNLGNYWTSAGPYDEIFYYIEKNVGEVREDLALMVSGVSVPAKIQEYAATSMNLQTKDEIFSAMVVYGFLSYEKRMVSIPNREVQNTLLEWILGVGIEYDKESKKHSCIVERL